MTIRPVIWFFVGVIVALLFMQYNPPKGTNLTTVVTHVDTIRYPETVVLEKPRTIVKRSQIVLRDTVFIDSLDQELKRQLSECGVKYEELLAALYQSAVGDTIWSEEELSVHRDTVVSNEYSLEWEIGVLGKLNHFEYVINTKTQTINKLQSLGLTAGVYSPVTTVRPGLALGLSYEKNVGYHLSYLPRERFVVFSVNKKFFRW